MKKLAIFLTIILAIAAFSAPVFAGGRGVPIPPDGVVYGLNLGSTWYGIQQAVSSKPGTFMMIREGTENIIFAWHIENAAAFTCLGAGGANCAKDIYNLIQSGKGGNVVNFSDMVALRDFLKENGWKVIGSAEVPLKIKAMLTGASLMAMAESMPTILILPAGVFDYKPYQTWRG